MVPRFLVALRDDGMKRGEMEHEGLHLTVQHNIGMITNGPTRRTTLRIDVSSEAIGTTKGRGYDGMGSCLLQGDFHFHVFMYIRWAAVSESSFNIRKHCYEWLSTSDSFVSRQFLLRDSSHLFYVTSSEHPSLQCLIPPQHPAHLPLPYHPPSPHPSHPPPKSQTPHPSPPSASPTVQTQP